MKRRQFGLCLLGLLLLFSSFLPLLVQAQDAVHPRLWLRAADLPRLRSWAMDSNPIYMQLAALADQGLAYIQDGTLPNADTGSVAWEEYPNEEYALLFAFMSLISPDEARRADYAQAARALLMHVINEAAKGSAAGEPYRDPQFTIGDRSRWYGASFGLTVDWIYPYLTVEDKATIRAVFLRWAAELQTADMTNQNHPEPVGIINDPVLVSEPNAVRWAGNNYYTAHMRNMGLMALAFDAADDPNGELKAYLNQAIGAWLYVEDYLLRTDAASGLGTEGMEYSPQSLGYVAQFLLALYTAGESGNWGTLADFNQNPFWNATIPAYLHSLSPRPIESSTWGEAVYLPAWYGSGQNYWMPDHIELFGPLGIFYARSGNPAGWDQTRWIQTYTPPGGESGLSERAHDAEILHKNILYFLLFDPTVTTPPTDPRPALPTTFYAPGMRRLLARTDWSADASWFTYNLSWDVVDHQAGGGNAIEFYRQGEWLTKVRVGYDLDYLSSDNHNTLTIQNDRPDREDFRAMLWERGSQWLYDTDSPPPPFISANADPTTYVYASGDATALYNSAYEELHGVTHASRSVIWLLPDTIVVYDRAETAAEGRQKRFWLNFPDKAVIDGQRVTMTTASGQQLVVQTLLPEDAAITVEPLTDEPSGAPANGEMMRYRLRVESPAQPPSVRFLHVLQATDTNDTLQPIQLLTGSTASEPLAGAVIGNAAVVFPVSGSGFSGTISYTIPAIVTTHYLTGLTPQATYDVTVQPGDNGNTITVTAGATDTADSGGVLVVKLP